MKNRKEYLSGVANKIKGMIKPSIRRLPPEILLHVFSNAGEQSKTRTILTLGQVCSHWRILVHSTPQLWSEITVEFRVSDNAKSTQRILRWTKFLLKKAQSSHLDIHLTVPEYPWERYIDEEDEEQDRDYDTETHLPVVTELVRHSAKWKTVDLTVMRDEVFSLPQDLPHLTTLSVLRHLVLDDPDPDWIADPGPPSPLFAPHLSDLSLTGVGVRLVEPVDLNSLTNLTLEVYYMDTLLGILRHAPNLVELHVHGNAIALAHNDLVVTSRVRTFEAGHLSSVPGLFRHLTLPCLSSLHVSETMNELALVVDHEDQLAHFISRSRPPLAELCLRVSNSLSQEGLDQVLAVVPTTTSLTIGDPRFPREPYLVTDDLLRRLTITSDSSTILPNVTSLRLHFGTPPTSSCIRDMVRSRLQRPANQQLKKLRLVFEYCPYRKLGRVLQECMDELRKEDLDFDVEYWSLPDIIFGDVDSETSDE
ncbi:hypothetical protein VNI00_008464 [Paramarasmius palmivorus]|uniref:F-box domain-containing protein n=1 Tax=Paramarasmius palmivorus TaxID=297713 RepID=A0AAW0CXT9_9AGAR